MSQTLLTILTVIEVVALVGTLAAFLIGVAVQLRSIASTLAEVAWGARAVERQLRAAPSNARNINATLGDIGQALPGLTSKIEATQ